MSAQRASQLATEAVNAIGVEHFHDSRRGPAILADLVGGDDPEMYRWSTALEVACALWAERDVDALTESEFTDAIRGRLSDGDDAAWAASTWQALMHAQRRPGRPLEPDEPDPEPDDKCDPALNLVPILVVVVLILALVIALALAG